MHSIRTKITMMTVCLIIAVMSVATAFGVVAIKKMGDRSASRILSLLCEAGQKNLDSYFVSVEQSVDMVVAYVENDLVGGGDEDLRAHLDRVSDIFQKLTYKTNGILTYYYRIDPDFSREEDGFWYVYKSGKGFQEHEVTDITLYDTDDTTGLVWFTVPKNQGKSVWLPPYITDNLGVRVISYNVPVYLNERFVGVIGIEIEYTEMASKVDDIKLYENGYAFLNDTDGCIVYHPRMDVTTMQNRPKVPEGLLSEDSFIRYEYEGVQKEAVWLPLGNGMRLNVTVPVREMNADWQRWGSEIAVIFFVMLVVFVVLILRFLGHITRPLWALTEAAEQVDAGNYDCVLDYDGQDEIGVLTRTFKRLTVNLKAQIEGLNTLAYADSLTKLRNKAAFDDCMRGLQEQIDAYRNPDFADLANDAPGEIISNAFGADLGTGKGIPKIFGTAPGAALGSGKKTTTDTFGTTSGAAAKTISDVFRTTPGASEKAKSAAAPEFAVCIFDCNDLKVINDRDGHGKGDIYLKGTAAAICEIFDHSPVFRLGGDEFAAVLMNRDYQNRAALLEQFDALCAAKRAVATEPWERLDIARGMAVFDPRDDDTTGDVVRRADKLMYENKYERKRAL